MKNIILLSMLGFFSTQVNAAPLPTHFTTATTVYYVGQTETKLQLTIYEESASSWAYLTVLAGDPESYKLQQESLQKAYPNLSVERVLSRGTGKATVKIGALRMSKDVDWEPYQNGPGVNVVFELSKAQTMQVIAAKDLSVTITGKIKAYVTVMSVVETRSLSAAPYCDVLLKNGGTIEQVLLNYPIVSKMIDGVATRFPNTKQSLKKDVLHQCLEVATPDRIETFKDLLEMNVVAANPTIIRGETRMETPSEKEADFSSEIPKTLTSTVGG